MVNKVDYIFVVLPARLRTDAVHLDREFDLMGVRSWTDARVMWDCRLTTMARRASVGAG